VVGPLTPSKAKGEKRVATSQAFGLLVLPSPRWLLGRQPNGFRCTLKGMRLRRIAACVLVAGLAGSLSGCRKQKPTVFLDTAWNRDYAMNACELYKQNYGVACFKTPEQIAEELKLRFSSAVLQSPACRDVAVSYEPLGKQNLKAYEDGWSLSFNVGIDGGDIDYSNSEWQIIDNNAKKRLNEKRFSEGPLKDAVEAATRICIVATGQGGSVSH
jgi:hypothetical protein